MIYTLVTPAAELESTSFLYTEVRLAQVKMGMAKLCVGQPHTVRIDFYIDDVDHLVHVSLAVSCLGLRGIQVFPCHAAVQLFIPHTYSC